METNHNHSAGKLITDRVPVVGESATIGDVEKLLLNKAAEFVSINYIYVVNGQKELLGVVSIKEVFRSPKTALVKKYLLAKIISVRSHTDQERVAYLAIKHNLKAVPVVDKNNQFLGVVPSDTILKVLDSEAVENLLRFGGVMHTASMDDVLHLSLFKSLKHRLPWLVLGLLGGVFASGVISNFSEVLERHLILAAFIPLIVYMASAVGMQMQAFIIRDLAMEAELKFFKYFARQFLVVLLISAILSVLFYIGGFLFFDNAKISFVVALALFLATVSSMFTGLVVPFLFSKLKMDPANASGPIATIIQDILSIVVYLGVGTALLL